MPWKGQSFLRLVSQNKTWPTLRATADMLAANIAAKNVLSHYFHKLILCEVRDVFEHVFTSCLKESEGCHVESQIWMAPVKRS